MIEILASTLRLSTPLLFACMGGLLCERSGVATICLEGAMIVGAWTSATVTYYSHNPWLGLTAGLFAGMLCMGTHAFLSVSAKADQIVSGVAVNTLAAGITPLLSKWLFGGPTNTASIPLEDRFSNVHVPYLSDLPVVGELIFSQKPLTYLAVILPFVLAKWLRSSGIGLRLMASGDGPEALATAGVSPSKVRWLALLCGGALASMGGTYLSISHGSQFIRDMTAGRGYIALTALIFGKWRPIPALYACLFFGFTDALQIRLQSVQLFGSTVPVQFIQSLPYLVTLVVLVGFIGKARPPLSIGRRDV